MSPRPRFHFSPKSGWINDPNGLVYIDGVWHMFYQHNPQAIVHGPMHWGHASSADLAAWKELPIALYPEAGRENFSGSAVLASDGVVDPRVDAQVLLYYTAHRRGPDGSDDQEQALALADRSLTTFRRYPGNPVIANPGLRAFRDPKVIWHAPSRRWVMVVTHGQEVGIHVSPDGILWSLASTFGVDAGRHGEGPWECPDLFPLPFGDSELWVLVVGLAQGGVAGGSATQYFVGLFDGRAFTNLNSPRTELWLDQGADYYAAQSWSGAPVATSVAWMSNWDYAQKTPATAYRGEMTLPRELRLVATSAGPRICQRVVPGVAEKFETMTVGSGRQKPPGGTYRFLLPLEPLADEVPLAVSLFGEAETFSVVRSGVGCVAIHSRNGDPDGRKRASTAPFRVESGSLLEVFVDQGAVEMGTSDGLVWVSNRYFPADPSGEVTILGSPAGGARDRIGQTSIGP